MQTVVHLISADESEQNTALAIVGNLLAEKSGRIDDVAVVAQSAGVEALLADGDHADQIRSLLDDGVSFSVCSNTLEGRGLDESDFVDGVETVSEGAVEVTRLQDEGYAYIRP